ncbi:MAG: diaminopimelate decarboxylase [Rhodospirillales bacterium]|nr:diaminopimelate decarboxylase [Rhodospirillales bacterium]
MDHFAYRNGVLHCEEVPIPAIAEAAGTPVYVYASATLERHYRVLAEALAGLKPQIHFALKANASLGVIATLARLGAGADVVSGGELRLALAAGVPARLIVFSGVGKTDDELRMAIATGIYQINVESEPELDRIAQLARDLGRRAPVALRVNPDIDAGTHVKITTGTKENKFGIEWARAPAIARRAKALAGIEFVGLAVHIGSQLTSLAPFEAAFLRLRDLVALLKGEGIEVRRLDLGGGLGVPYEPAKNETPPLPADYGTMIRRTLGDLDLDLSFEPGRLLVGNAGILVSRVIRVKEGATKSFLILDAGMNDLMRPALYDAYHDIRPVLEPRPGAPRRAIDVVGPICETSDTFARQRLLPALAEGDLVAIGTAGAYGASMASEYNGRPLVPEVLVRGGDYALTRPRPSLDEMLARQMRPRWLDEPGP